MNKAKRSFWLVCTLFFLGLLVTAESLAVERILRRNEAIAEERHIRNTEIPDVKTEDRIR